MSIFEKIFGPSQKTLTEMEEKIRADVEEERMNKEAAEQEAREAEEAEELAKEKAEEERQAEIKKAAENIIEEKMESDEPWVEMVGASVDPEKGIRVELNWNPAFIKYLREGGIQGASEEECAQRWLAMISKDIDGRYADDDDDGKDNSLYQ